MLMEQAQQKKVRIHELSKKIKAISDSSKCVFQDQLIFGFNLFLMTGFKVF